MLLLASAWNSTGTSCAKKLRLPPKSAQSRPLPPLYSFRASRLLAASGSNSAFGVKALEVFQDLVAKEFAIETGGLAQRGVVRHRDAARLHITNIVRGSFGFRLDELTEEPPLMETALKTAVSRALVLMDAFAHEDDQRFQEVVEATDQRVFNAAKDFFKLMHDEQARFKALSENFDRTFDALDIDRAFSRGEVTGVADAEEQVRGVLMGVLPDGHQFEFRREEPPDVIRGKVDRELSADVLASYNRDWLDRQSIAAVRVRRVLKGEEVVRESFLLLRLLPVEQNLLP